MEDAVRQILGSGAFNSQFILIVAKKGFETIKSDILFRRGGQRLSLLESLERKFVFSCPAIRDSHVCPSKRVIFECLDCLAQILESFVKLILTQKADAE